MPIRFSRLVILSLILLFSNATYAQSSDAVIAQKVQALLQKMTLEEKIGQMNQYNGFWQVTGPVPEKGNAKQKYDHLRAGLVGSVLNVKGVADVRKLQEIVVKESRLGIPLIFGLDVIHGHKTLGPIPLAEVASWDLPVIQKSAANAAKEAAAVGINWTFAPMVDITRDARWGRVMEGAGEDPYLGSLVGAARIRGFQGDDLSLPTTIAACAKHFAAYGFAEAGKEYNTVDMSMSTLYNIIFPPFKAAINADVSTVMNSFNTLNGIPATGNVWLQRNILKGDWGFKGFVISDWGSMQEMIAHGYSSDLKEAALQSITAGSDMDMESSAYVGHLKNLVDEGKVPVALIDDAAARILTIKYKLGLFDDPYRYCDTQREKETVYSPALAADALDMAKRSIVLLKNDSAGKKAPLLPLRKEQKNIVVIGALAAEKTSPLGSWRVGSDDGTAISVLEGLTKYKIAHKYSKGTDVTVGKVDFIHEVNINQKDSSGFAAAVAQAKGAEVVIMVLGEHGFMSGEGRSRSEIGLPGLQQQLLEAVYKVNKNIVLVLMNGRPLTIPWAAEKIPAIVEAWQLGTQSGNAIAEVLTGAYNPSGKLPMSFPRAVGQLPLYYNHFFTGRGGEKSEVFWAHYSDVKNSPQYAFGFGLSYTKFAYSNLSIDSSDNKNIKVKVTVENTGDRAGEEVVQLYIQDRFAKIVRPVKELKGFKKINLEPRKSQTVEFTLTDAELGYYDNDGNYFVESGVFGVQVGGSSDAGLKGSFNVVR